MQVRIASEDMQLIYVDRDGVAGSSGRQGFCIMGAGVNIHFADEADAERLAEEVLRRLGRKVV
jgi:hypothetical protein